MHGTAGAVSTAGELVERAKFLSAHEPNFGRFLRQTVAATDPGDLEARRPEEIENTLRESFARLGKRPAGEAMVHLVAAPREEREIVDVFAPNMPFLVDSVLAAVRAKGGVVRLLAHPVLAIDPGSFRILDDLGDAPGSTLESFLHLHLDPLPDEAAREALVGEIEQVLRDVARVTSAWKPMREQVFAASLMLQENAAGLARAEVDEAVDFLSWLADDNFTFLGIRAYEVAGEGGGRHLRPVVGSGLGLLADEDFHFLRAGTAFVEMTGQHTAFLDDREPVLVTKASMKSRVHRRSHMDYVGVKLFSDNGNVSGELRILGLFTTHSQAIAHHDVPLVRRKVSAVMRRSGLDPASHAGKALTSALEAYPRDELFQIGEEQLLEFATLVAALADRPRVRVLPRVDRFDNFVSVLCYLPRERYTSELRARVGDYLCARYDGRLSAYYPHFPEGDLVRVHFIIGRYSGPTPSVSREELERGVEELARTFGERLAAAASDPDWVEGWQDAFSPAYQSRMSLEDALADIAIFTTLAADTESVAVRLRPGNEGRGPDTLELRVYHRASPIPLSDRVPMLENFGFRVIDERTYTLAPDDGTPRFLHDMEIVIADGARFDFSDPAAPGRIEAAILAVWRGEAESDGFNRLTLRARLAWFDVAVLRALGRYLRQVGLGYSQSHIAGVLAAHPDVAAALIQLFHAHHDPDFAGNRDRAAHGARSTIGRALDATQSLDEDVVLRRMANLVEASLRTNFYQRDAEGRRRPALAVKFDCGRIEDIPKPTPYREIFVYSPRVEGVHLRFGAIARGGIRWSDRPEDFRTEVLGLVKAQQVKNAVIVPVGAKGGFVPKRAPAGPREAIQAEGVACYTIFIGALLDITDNLRGDLVIAPEDTRRRDGDDPYLVVAADKGTASFSDTANAIALSRGYWLGDAFASGGSVGYDHKKMGITARGAWESVKRHFRELDRDIQETPVTVAGVGDMSGDVFGNGMLLSRQIRLVAAFDHRDIFVDPAPDAERSFAERERLFGLARSSWQDFDQAVLSKGGGVYPRNAKNVPLSAEARELLELPEGSLTPAEVIRAILRAPVDLLWFGGIGTYVRASSESDLAAGDRANDAVRVAGRELRARVVGEGANLAMTQLGRVEYARTGGRLNTDAIDNSAGVNSSDLEVNIKIALGGPLRAGNRRIEERNAFLPKMTGEVAALCLANNYLQPLALSLSQRAGVADLSGHVALIRRLEARGQLLRQVEFLPDDSELAARAAAGQGLTRPELAVLLAYAKNSLFADLLDSEVPDDPYLGDELYRYFPEMLGETWPDAVTNHRLRREIISTVLANAMINRGGPAYVVEIMAATSADAGRVAGAYAAVRDSFLLREIGTQIDALDGAVGGEGQLALYAEVRALLLAQTLWFVRNTPPGQGLADIVERFRAPIAELRDALPGIAGPSLATEIDARSAGFASDGVPEPLARRIAELAVLAMGPDIVLVAGRAGCTTLEAAEVHFGIIETFGLARILEESRALELSDPFDRMALDRALANLTRAQRDLASDVLAFGDGPVAARLAAWHAEQAAAIERIAASVASLTEGALTVSRLSVAAGLLSDLARTN